MATKKPTDDTTAASTTDVTLNAAAPDAAAAPAATADPGDGTGITYDLPDIVRRVGKPTDAERAAFAIDLTESHLTATGAQISTARILKDLLRWSGQLADFLDFAARAKLILPLGFSRARLKVFVDQLVRAQELYDRYVSALGAHDKTAITYTTTAAIHMEEGALQRDELRAALVSSVPAKSVAAKQIERVSGSCATGADLAKSLRDFAALATELLAKKGTPPAIQLEAGGVTEKTLADIRSLADKVAASTARITGAKQKMDVTQSELDLQDGLCLAHMENMQRLFEAGHARDRRIPLLVPITTRSLLGTRTRRAAKDENAENTDTPAAETDNSSKTQ